MTGNGKLYKRAAIIRVCSSLVLAALALSLVGFAPFTLLAGAKQTDSIMDNEFGDYVKKEVKSILGYYGEDKSDKGEVTGRYAVVPMDGKLATVHFTKRYLETADAVCAATYDFINGDAESLNSYCTVVGTVAELSNDASALMYDWFGYNYDQMLEMDLIGETEDYADYVTDYVLEVDTVKGYSMSRVTVMTIVAAFFFIIAILDAVMVITGYYEKKYPAQDAKTEDK